MEITLENKKEILVFLNKGLCPICGKGPYKNPLLHIWKQHDISSREIRDILLITTRDTFCSPGLREIMSNKAKESDSHLIANSATRGKNFKKEHNLVQESRIKNDTEYKGKYMVYLREGAKKAAESNKKPVYKILPDGEKIRYSSITEAAQANSVDKDSIINCLKGRTRTCIGCKWIYESVQ